MILQLCIIPVNIPASDQRLCFTVPTCSISVFERTPSVTCQCPLLSPQFQFGRIQRESLGGLSPLELTPEKWSEQCTSSSHIHGVYFATQWHFQFPGLTLFLCRPCGIPMGLQFPIGKSLSRGQIHCDTVYLKTKRCALSLRRVNWFWIANY